ncbi:hypothetical protein DDI_3014 [Dickeya dianthicola RNS04.9]|nr:hypothetical protein DDI_3014 [Dickeya dianthicola RNS04.9]
MLIEQAVGEGNVVGTAFDIQRAIVLDVSFAVFSLLKSYFYY